MRRKVLRLYKNKKVRYAKHTGLCIFQTNLWSLISN